MRVDIETETRFRKENGVTYEQSVIMGRDPTKLTYSGRHSYIDWFLIQYMGLLEENKGIRALDFASGVVDETSPTTRDLAETVARFGGICQIDAVDRVFKVDSIDCLFPGINYYRTLADNAGQYNLVRALNWVMHVGLDEYQQTRQKLIDRLVEGGLLVNTQEIVDFSRGITRPKYLHVEKVSQKIAGKLVPKVFLPRSMVSMDSFRNEVTVSCRRDWQEYCQAMEIIGQGQHNLQAEHRGEVLICS